ncbi:MAG: AAA family ATPase [Candidatus Omnitrophota bacterium]|nr:AAA family ATPase [Candidatus Omnitrophota bacterium]MDZ4242394.1 AAA family ATPase [Candidatus Omnitrophota bacterium]
MNPSEDLLLLLKSRHPVIYYESPDETGAINEVQETARRLNMLVYQWSVSNGMGIGKEGGFYKTADPAYMLKTLLTLLPNLGDSGAVILLKDFQKYLDDAYALRLFKDVINAVRSTPSTVIVLAAEYKFPQELEPDMVRFLGGYPDTAQIRNLLDEVIREMKRVDPAVNVGLDEAGQERVLHLLKGLTAQQIRSLVTRCVLNDFMLDFGDIKTIEDFKKRLFDQEGLLEYCSSESSGAVAGFENLKRWIGERKQAFSGAPPADLPPPKGILLVGVQGCGKSLVVKAAAGEMGLPLYRLDISALYSKYIGETETNLRKALMTVDKLSPLCLWIDEIEKGLASSGADVDGGVSQRILGTFLTWMQERKSRCFVAATANNVFKLPPELLRKGRFDEVFFVDLPNAKEREEIFKIHLGRRSLSPDKFECRRLAERSVDFSGAEIEQAVIAALYSAKAKGLGVTQEDVLSQIAGTKPLAVLRREDVEAVRDWCRDRTVRV